jgi:UDP-N-acetylglucosamine--N-acetylmuramyl-(pentapeptide) pyrophosphoryl-undecaprenol N-acetylglucosamine transferase
MVVVPYPHAGGHQRANAEILAAAGAAELVEDADFDAAALIRAAALLHDSTAHLQMSAAARDEGRPGAADAVAALMAAMADRGPRPEANLIERISRGLT